jgi:chemotaxis protein methyltransferase CheR
VFDPTLLADAVFAQHNLATDRSFNEFDLVICRNVLIYFGRQLQDRVLTLFDESLTRRGVLALGRKETLGGTTLEDRFEPLVSLEKIYRRRT